MIKQPNLTGPRFRRSHLSLLNTDMLNTFKEKYPEYKSLSLQEFKDVIAAFNGNIVQGVIENRNGVELPEGLGFIFIGSCPPSKKKCVDYKKSAELGQVVTFKNWDSDNHLMKIFYTNRPTKYPFQNKQVWKFSAVKQFRKKASDAYIQNYSKYMDVLPTLKITAMFDRYRKKDYLKNLKPIIPEGYNEFNL